MAYMIIASSPLSAQSFVKLRTNSNYFHSPCYISRAKNSYIHLPYNNISHIDSSKSLFLKGDINFSFSSPKFPRVASTNSPSLNIIKAYKDNENIYHFLAHDVKIGKDIKLEDRYKGKVLLIVNLTPQTAKQLPPQYSSEDVEVEVKYLNYLYSKYKDKPSLSVKGFEVLGFFPHMEEKRHWLPWGSKEETGNPKLADGEEEIYYHADFPIFRKVYTNDALWNFLRRDFEKDENQEFEKFLVDGTGKPVQRFPWFTGETEPKSKIEIKPGEYPGDEYYIGRPTGNPRLTIEDAIDKYFPPPKQ